MKPLSDESAEADNELNLAQQLFKEFYGACFWHMKPDLVITEAMLPLIAKGLRTHGGRQGWLAAERLEKSSHESPPQFGWIAIHGRFRAAQDALLECTCCPSLAIFDKLPWSGEVLHSWSSR
jgi:hypothetical protein